MIAIDLDGTLLPPDGSVSMATKAAIRNALHAGLLICFATGRNFTESRAILHAVDHYDNAVFVSGAMVIDTKAGVTLHRRLMNPNLARQLCAFFEDRRQVVLALQDSHLENTDYWMSTSGVVNPATAQWLKVTESAVHPRNDLATADHAHTVRVGIVAAPDDIRWITTDLEATFGSRVVHHSLFVPSYGVEVMEVFDPAVNKWEGISHVAKIHGIDPSQIIAIGDDVNDLPMIRNAGLGIAMGNAKPVVQQAAKRVIGKNVDDGLAKFIEELLTARAVQPEDGSRAS